MALLRGPGIRRFPQCGPEEAVPLVGLEAVHQLAAVVAGRAAPALAQGNRHQGARVAGQGVPCAARTSSGATGTGPTGSGRT